MTSDLPHARRDLARAAYMLLGSAAAIALIVIPAIELDKTLGATPNPALPLFWGVCGLYTAAATALALYSPRAHYRTSLGAWLCIAAGLLIGLWVGPLIDAAATYAHHQGPARVAAAVLSLCAAASLGCAALLLKAWAQLPSDPRREPET